MGMILESTPEMGEYSVEVRKESFYLHGQGRHVIFVYPQQDEDFGTAEILTEDIPKIRACLDEIERYIEERER